MDKEKIEELLKAIPGARRAADGIIIDTKEGMFHLTGLWDKSATQGLTDEEKLFLAFCSRNEIFRLRNIKTAHDALLKHRAYAIVDAPRAVRVMRRRREEYERNGRKWSLTEYYHSMDGFHKSYIDNLSRSERRILRAVPAGLALENEANAMCFRSFTGDIVVASEALQFFYYFMTIGMYGNQHDIDLSDRLHALVIAMRIMTRGEALDFDIDPRGVLPISVERSVKKLVSGQMAFTFGHEYAHYLGNHLSLPVDPVFEGTRDADTAEQLKLFTHDLEYEADFYAVKRLEHNVQAQRQVMAGAHAILLYLYFLHGVMEHFGFRKLNVYSTHPEPLDRLWRLWDSLGQSRWLPKASIEGDITAIEQMKSLLLRMVENSQRKDLLSFYGSVYLPGFKEKILRDRVDF